MTWPWTRKRVNSQTMTDASSEVNPFNAYYRFHEGDIFTPGTGNWAMDRSGHEPVTTLWGHGFLYRANQFAPLPTPPVVYPGRGPMPQIPIAGIPGIDVGNMIGAPLVKNPAPEQGGL